MMAARAPARPDFNGISFQTIAQAVCSLQYAADFKSVSAAKSVCDDLRQEISFLRLWGPVFIPQYRDHIERVIEERQHLLDLAAKIAALLQMIPREQSCGEEEEA